MCKCVWVLVAALAFAVSPLTADILVYDNNTSFHRAQAAVTSLGLPFTVAGTGDFYTQLGAHPWDVVVLDLPSTEPDGDYTPLVSYIGGGGRVLMSFWRLESRPALAAAFEVSVVATFESPLNVYAWDGGHPIFSTPGAAGPLDTWTDQWLDDGDRMNPLGAAVALGGFTLAPAADEAAIVLGNSGRTLYNGFLWDETVDSTQLIANQVDFLLHPVPEPSSWGLMALGVMALWRSGVRRRS